MLPRPQRLRRGGDFAAVYRRGQRWHSELLTLHCLARPGLPLRAGFVVGRQVGGAVVRNRVRRRLRELVRRDLPRLTLGVDTIIAARPSAATASFDTLAAAWRGTAQRAGLLTADDSAPAAYRPPSPPRRGSRASSRPASSG